eukprot:s2389_g1.t1
MDQKSWAPVAQHESGATFHPRGWRSLIYEFLAGGDVSKRLQRSRQQLEPFRWNARLSAAVDAACGLSHLHNVTPRAFHRDIKGPNILLDKNGTAKMADFGLSCVSEGAQHKVKQASGTVGYACPEYIRTGIITEGSEVHSFGMVVLELLTGAPPAVEKPNKPGESFRMWRMAGKVWQWGNTRENSGEKLGKCSTGRGLECQSERFDDFLVLAGQRISHGTVSETIQLEKGRWCRGLGMKQAEVRAVSAVGTYKAEVLQCRDVCYQDSGCSIWEHSTKDGCWYGYSDRCSRSFSEAETMVAGERVARACGPGVLLQEPTDYVKVFGIISFVAFLLFCFGVLAVACGALCGAAPERRGSRDDALLSDSEGSPVSPKSPG